MSLACYVKFAFSVLICENSLAVPDLELEVLIDLDLTELLDRLEVTAIRSGYHGGQSQVHCHDFSCFTVLG
jgi:hypothetical protein